MLTELGTIRAKVVLDLSGLKRGGEEAKKTVAQVGEDMRRKLRKQREEMAHDLHDFGRSLTIGLSAPLGALAVAATKTAVEMDSLKRGLRAVAGSSEEAERQLKRLKEVAKLPGLGMEEAIRGSIRLQAAGLSARMAERMLRGFGNAIATVGGGKAELDGVALALGQMAAKGKVFAEEINQINERVPQIRQLMKEAFGTASTEELQKMGVTAEQFFEKIGAQLEKLPQVTGGAKNAMENFGDSSKRALDAVGQAILPIVTSFLDKVTPAIEGAGEKFRELPQEAQTAAVGIGVAFAVTGPALMGLGALIGAIDKAKVGMVALRTAVNGVGASAGVAALLRILNSPFAKAGMIGGLLIGSEQAAGRGGDLPNVPAAWQDPKGRLEYFRNRLKGAQGLFAQAERDLLDSRDPRRTPRPGAEYDIDPQQRMKHSGDQIVEFSAEIAKLERMLASPTAHYGKGDLRGLAAKMAAQYNISPALFAALIQQESNWNPRAVSSKGAKGLGQLMPGTARGLGVKDPFNPAENLRGSAQYLSKLLTQFGGDPKLALAAYNAGPGAVMKYRGIPPYKETQNYVKTIIANAASMSSEFWDEEKGLAKTPKEYQFRGAPSAAQLPKAIQDAARRMMAMAGFGLKKMLRTPDWRGSVFPNIDTSGQGFIDNLQRGMTGFGETGITGEMPSAPMDFTGAQFPAAGEFGNLAAEQFIDRLKTGMEAAGTMDFGAPLAEKTLTEFQKRGNTLFQDIALNFAEETASAMGQSLQKLFGGSTLGKAVSRAFANLLSSGIEGVMGKLLGGKKITGGLGDILGIGGLIGGLLGGFFSSGGVAPGRKFSVVGERGPEIIFPEFPTRVVPMDQRSGGGGSISVNFTGDVHIANDLDIRQVARQVGEALAWETRQQMRVVVGS